MTKKLMMLAMSTVVALGAVADTENVGGYTWTYQINSGTAEIYNGGDSAISPSPTGSLTIPATLGGKPVTSIGSYAFYYCTGLTSITIPSSVTSIGSYAFDYCYGLTNITIPSSVTSIGSSAFYGCRGLTEMTLPFVGYTRGNSGSSSSLFGYIFGTSSYSGGTSTRQYYSSSSYSTYYIPSGLKKVVLTDETVLGYGAFYNCSGLTSITIPSSVTSIGSSAFYGCRGLTEMTLPFVGNTRGNSGSSSSLFGYIFGTSSYSGGTSTKQYYSSSSYSTYYIPSGLKKVVLTDETVLGYGAFYNCSGLTGITIPSTVTSINSSAFSGCSGLRDVTVPQYVCSNSSYGMSYFFSSSYQYITNVVIADGATSIGSSVFSSCTGLTRITIPESVTSIGSSAFSGCSGLTSITIPATVTSIGSSAFYGCSGLTEMTLPFVGTTRGNTGTAYSLFGYIFGTSSYSGGTSTRQYYSSSSYSTYYVPSGLKKVVITDETVLGYGAFYNCSGLTNVTLPSSVTSIGTYAFYNCSGLTSITIPPSVTDIGDYVFYNCSGLTSITIPSRVTSIGSYAFYYCSDLTSITIPSRVTSIGSYAFYYCSDLTSLTIPASVTSIGACAFAGCSRLTRITLPTSIASIETSVFSNCSGLTNVTIPSSVTSIGSSAFSGCAGLTSIAIPSSVTSIGSSAFSGCTGLTGIAIPSSVTSIGSSAFSGCSGLTEMTLPFVGTTRGNTGTAYSLFGYIFGTSSYSGCTATTQYYSSISSSTYYIPSGLKKVVLTDETVLGYGAFYNCSGLTNVTLPSSVTSIGTYAFYNCSGLTGMTIPESVEDIGSYAFYYCSGLPGITIPSSVKSIGTAVFSGCSGLTSVAIPQVVCNNKLSSVFPDAYQSIVSVILADDVSRLAANFFEGCNEVRSVTWPSMFCEMGLDILPPKVRSTLGYNAKGLMIYNNWVLDYKNREAVAVTIPEGIVGIGRRAFFEMFELEEITLPESLRYIAESAFEGCTYIQEIDFPTSLRYVGPAAFWDCSALLWASFADGLETLGERAFDGCWQMQSVRLPSSVTNVGAQAFTGCSLLRGVTVPTNLKPMQSLFPEVYAKIESVEIAEGETTIMDDMFAGCSRMFDTLIPSTVTNIGARAFRYCTSLDAIVLPDSVVKMGEYAFAGCTAIWNVTLSRNLVSIPEYAFNGCSKLDSMIIPASVTYLGSRFFSGRTPGTNVKNALYYLGNAPDYSSSAYSAVSGDLTTYVLQDSRGWDGRAGSHTLPKSWNGYAITYWTPNRFDVIFDANGGRFDPSGGSTWSEQQITSMGYALPSTEPVRPGWAFNGWWTEQVGGAQVQITTLVTATRTHSLYAHWRSLEDRMTVTFNSNGGTVVVAGEQDYVPGQTFGQFPVPTRRGYRFEGWWTESITGILITEATEVPAADMELFAHWSPITYLVRFNANGGTGEMEDQVFEYDVRDALETHTFTRTGFAFSGWAVAPSDQVRYAEGASVVNLRETQGDVYNLYAVWSGAGYSVRFDSNGGTGIMDNQTIAIGETQNLWPCVFKRAGYAFTGWATKPTGSVVYRDGTAVRNLSTINDIDIPLYAVWAAASQTVRISFDANGGSVAPDYWNCVVGTAVEAFPLPTRPGFTFAGWFTAKTGGTRVESIQRVTGAQTFYAHWTANGEVVPGDGSFIVTFNPNGGSVSPASRTVAGGTAVGNLPAPTRTGFVFIGWFTAAEDGVEVTASTVVSGRVTYYAHWDTKCPATFDANGGTFSDGKTKRYVKAVPENLWGKMPIPSKSGQVFDGYYTAKTGGELVTASDEVPWVAVTYYAHWTPRLGLAAASEWSGAFTTDSWCGQGTVAHDNRDALRSGVIYDRQSSYLITRVSGSGILTFWWAVSCEGGGKDALRFLVDGEQKALISGDVDWTKVELPIRGVGTHVLKWNYTKNGSVTKGEDFGWLDQISWSGSDVDAFYFDANGGKFSNGASVKKTDAPEDNLWGKMYIPARDGYVFTGWYTAKEGGNLVTASDKVPFYYTTYYARWTKRLGLAAASEWSRAFETENWCGQSAVSHDGRDALRSGVIYDGQSSPLVTRVPGPGTLTFWWKVSCEAGGNDALRLLVDGAQIRMISGETDWTKVTVDVTGSGTHVIKWNYTKNRSITKGEDFGWIDQIGWTAK